MGGVLSFDTLGFLDFFTFIGGGLNGYGVESSCNAPL